MTGQDRKFFSIVFTASEYRVSQKADPSIACYWDVSNVNCHPAFVFRCCPCVILCPHSHTPVQLPLHSHHPLCTCSKHTNKFFLTIKTDFSLRLVQNKTESLQEHRQQKTKLTIKQHTRSDCVMGVGGAAGCGGGGVNPSSCSLSYS